MLYISLVMSMLDKFIKFIYLRVQCELNPQISPIARSAEAMELPSVGKEWNRKLLWTNFIDDS